MCREIRFDCPPARFVQWKAILHGGGAGPAPELDWVSIAYLPKNASLRRSLRSPCKFPGCAFRGFRSRRKVEDLKLPRSFVCSQPANSASSMSSAFNAVSVASSAQPGSGRFDAPPQGFSQKGYESVLWTSDDANDDQLEYSVYFRGENESTWRLLKDKLDVRFYSWDTTTMADGAYYLKIVASDAPSNPAGEVLTTDLESDRFVVANTPPSIAQLTADSGTGGGTAVRVRFQATSPASFIARAQYSLDAGEWTLVTPTGGLSDALRENYDFQLQKISAGEHTITVRVYDQFENVSRAPRQPSG